MFHGPIVGHLLVPQANMPSTIGMANEKNRKITVHDTTIEPGQRIITLLASANRDEREYPDPDEFVWNRPIERLLAFGRGQHFCLGVHVARLEIAIMVSEWLKRVPDFRQFRRRSDA